MIINQLQKLLTGNGNGNGINFCFEPNKAPNKMAVNNFFFLASTGAGGPTNNVAITKQVNTMAKL